MRIVIFESHSTTIDNESGLASGRFDAPLSPRGIREAEQLGERRTEEFKHIYCSELRRSYETAALAFPSRRIIRDQRLNEIDYGTLTRASKRAIDESKDRYIDSPYQAGESYTEAIHRVCDFIDSVALCAWTVRLPQP